MSPILVPTLAELRVELDRLDGQRRAASARNNADPNDRALETAWNDAATACWHVLDQIAALPASSIADLRVKAYAFDWSARLLDGESYYNPSDGEEAILRQLVSGLLDERIA
ncbi:hypothetical protein [Devosia naphthalenivorans]|uniref:hypothetical protein n=1 Tax=Devosia naphthalenivorans TaxID=2082392 RepID=UPI000D3B7E9D|nr:hypothetical protein [Devosia naphthalenivorans]